MIDKAKIVAMRTLGEGLDNDGQFWPEKDKKSLEDRFWGGDSITDIAIAARRSERAIIQQLTRQGLLRNETKKRNRVKNCPKKCICGKCENYEICPHSPKNRNTVFRKESAENV